MSAPPSSRSWTTTVAPGGLPPIRLSWKSYGPGEKVPRHDHTFSHLCLILRGEVHQRYGDRPAIEGGPGTAFLTPAGEPHANAFGRRGAELLSLCLEKDAADFLRADGVDLSVRDCRPIGAASPLVARLVAALRAERPSALALYGLSLEVLAGVIGKPEPDPAAWLAAVRERIDADPEVPASLAELARGAGVHPGQLARAFRSRYGESVGDALRRARTTRAVERILAGDEPLATIAAACGFYDQSHLTRAVRGATGLPPGRLRRDHRR